MSLVTEKFIPHFPMNLMQILNHKAESKVIKLKHEMYPFMHAGMYKSCGSV